MMRHMTYLPGVSTLSLDAALCNGCRTCTLVCPHGVLRMNGRQAVIHHRDGCMECGACAENCPVKAISVQAGVINLLLDLQDDLALTLQDHLNILKYLELGKAESAEKAVRDHVLNFKNKIFQEPAP